VLAEMKALHGGSHDAFMRAHSLRTREQLLAQELPADDAQRLATLAAESLAEQARIEAADTLDFESYRRQYLAPESLLA
jgi:glutamate--cysteine ligase